jgi:hypothetical protein
MSNGDFSGIISAGFSRATGIVNWRNIAILLIDPDFGEQTPQAGENA